MLRSGDRLGDWIVDAALGEGGMGTVYRVHSALTSRLDAAIKVLKPTSEASARPRFVREAEALAALRHPAVVRVMGFGEDEERGLLYLVMELAEGPTLRERMAAGSLALPEALAIFVPLASALSHAHEAGVVHRDVKPGNVILTDDGPRLVDFGIATTADVETLTSTGHMGTLAYMPPEAFRAHADADPVAADVYAVGLVLHEALTGVRVFPAEGPPAAVAAAIGVRKLQQGALDPGPAMPDKVRDLVRDCTDPQPGRRPSMAVVRDRLQSLVERRGGVATASDTRGPAVVVTDSTVHVPEPARVAGRKLIPLAFGVFALMALAMIVPIARQARSARDSRPDTTRQPPPTTAASRPVTTLQPPPTTAASRPETTAPPPPTTAASRPDTTAPPAPARAPLGGRWRLENVIDTTTHAAFQGLRLGYQIELAEDGLRVSGRGEKTSEAGRPLAGAARTPLSLQGRREADTVEVRFREQGTERTSEGTFRWTLSPDGRTLEGTFESDAAGASGRSVARRD
jgi:serine/threonine protein kinase